MPLPTPGANEEQDEFIARCMSALSDEFEDSAQRAAVCFKQWRERADDDDERRPLKGEVRVDYDRGGTRRILRGVAIVYDTLSQDLGGFRERIRPTAVDRSLRENLDIRALVEHDPAKVLARTSKGTLRLHQSNQGLMVEVDVGEQSYAQDILISVQRGDVSGMSFAYRTRDEDKSWVEWAYEDGMPVRTVKDMQFREVSVVTFPAFVSTRVDVAQRALKRWQEANAVYRPSLKLLDAMHRQRLVDGDVSR